MTFQLWHLFLVAGTFFLAGIFFGMGIEQENIQWPKN